jgi:creatinine amidohydrolase
MLLANMTQPEAEEALRRGSVVLVTGSIEQHGGHLPLGTDAFAALTIALRVGERLQAPVVPLTSLGVAPYHLPWPGTLSLRPETLAALMVDVCEGLAGAGVKRVVVVNWHEGNSTAVRLGADRAQQQFPLRVVVAESHVITNALFPD